VVLVPKTEWVIRNDSGGTAGDDAEPGDYGPPRREVLVLCLARAASRRRVSSRRAMSAVPADSRSGAGHEHGGNLFGHGIRVVVVRTSLAVFRRGQVPQD
jgi:hypothetical protein